MELLQFQVHDVGESLAALDGIEDLDQFLLLLDGEHEIGADDVGEPADVVHLDRRKNLFDIRVLAELQVLLELLRSGAVAIVS